MERTGEIRTGTDGCHVNELRRTRKVRIERGDPAPDEERPKEWSEIHAIVSR